jgi:hypothetical protein
MSALDILNFTIYHNNKLYTITAFPYLIPAKDGMPLNFETSVDGKSIGVISCDGEKPQNENLNDDELLQRIVSFIFSQYKSQKADTA